MVIKKRERQTAICIGQMTMYKYEEEKNSREKKQKNAPYRRKLREKKITQKIPKFTDLILMTSIPERENKEKHKYQRHETNNEGRTWFHPTQHWLSSGESACVAAAHGVRWRAANGHCWSRGTARHCYRACRRGESDGIHRRSWPAVDRRQRGGYGGAGWRPVAVRPLRRHPNPHSTHYSIDSNSTSETPRKRKWEKSD